MSTVNVPLTREITVAVQLRGPAGPVGSGGGGGIPVSNADPVAPTDGYVYYNSALGEIRYYRNSDGWQQLLKVGDSVTTAARWETARTLLLDGDAAGSVEVDGSQNVTLTVTVAGLDAKANTADLGSAAFTPSTDYASAAQGALAASASQPGHGHTKADITDFDENDYATGAEGDLAATAVQPGDLAQVATTGAYSDLAGRPVLGSAAGANTGDFASAAQGAKADSAVQPGDVGTAAALDVAPAGDAAAGQVVKGDDTRLSDTRDPNTHTHPVSQIADSTPTGRALVTAADAAAARTAIGAGTSSFDGTYAALSGKPALGSAADNDETDFEPAGAVATHEGAHAPVDAITAAQHAQIDHTGIPGVGSGGGAVDSVNGQTGVVVLDAGDVGADPAGSAVAAQSAAEATAAAALAAHHAPGSTDHDDRYTPSSSLAPVATSGDYTDLTGRPTLGTAAGTSSTDYATAAQGALADSASQPGHAHTESDITDLGSYPDSTGQPATKVPQTDGAGGWTFEDPAVGGSGPDPTGATDGHVWTADGAGGAGWEALPAGSAGPVNGLLLEEVSSGALSGATATIPLPSGYEGFKLVVYSRSTDPDGTADRMAARFTVGGVEQSGLSDYSWRAGGPGVASTLDTADSLIALGLTTNAGADDYGYAEITIDSRYDDPTHHTSVMNLSIAAASDAAWSSTGGGVYLQPAVVDGIVLSFDHQGWGGTSFEGDSSYVLYGFVPASTASSGGGGHEIQSDGTPLTQRDSLNFTGAGVTVTDEPAAAAEYEAAVTADAPTVWLRFTETSGTVADDTRNSQDGTYVGGPTLGVEGPVGSAVTFDGVDDEITLPSGTAPDPDAGDSTIELWYKGTDAGVDYSVGSPNDDGACVLVSAHTDSTNKYWIVAVNHLGQLEVFHDNNLRRVPTTTVVNDDSWHHIAVGIAGGGNPRIDVYVDGVLAAAGTTTTVDHNGAPAIHIGRNPRVVSDAYLVGSIAEFAVYPVKLSEARIAAHASAFFSPAGGVTTVTIPGAVGGGGDVLVGSGAPGPTTGETGQAYLDTDTGDMYGPKAFYGTPAYEEETFGDAATNGTAWTVAQGADENWTERGENTPGSAVIVNGEGVVCRQSSSEFSKFMRWPRGVAWTDQEVIIRARFDIAAINSTNWFNVGAVARSRDYSYGNVFNAGWCASITRNRAGSGDQDFRISILRPQESTSFPGPVVSVPANTVDLVNDVINIKIRCVGTTVDAELWLNDDPEPAYGSGTWSLTYTAAQDDDPATTTVGEIQGHPALYASLTTTTAGDQIVIESFKATDAPALGNPWPLLVDESDKATAAQGALADTAVQPGDNLTTGLTQTTTHGDLPLMPVWTGGQAALDGITQVPGVIYLVTGP